MNISELSDLEICKLYDEAHAKITSLRIEINRRLRESKLQFMGNEAKTVCPKCGLKRKLEDML